MDPIIRHLLLDLSGDDAHPNIIALKGDSVRELRFSFAINGRPYPIPDGSTVHFRAKRPNGTVSFQSCTVQNGIASLLVSSGLTSSPGTFPAEISVIDNSGKKVTSPRFFLTVIDTVLQDSEIEASNEFSALTALIADLNSRLESGAFNGVSVEDASISAGGHLLLTLSSGAVIDAGIVRDEGLGLSVEAGLLSVTYTDNTNNSEET